MTLDGKDIAKARADFLDWYEDNRAKSRQATFNPHEMGEPEVNHLLMWLEWTPEGHALLDKLVEVMEIAWMKGMWEYRRHKIEQVMK